MRSTRDAAAAREAEMEQQLRTAQEHAARAHEQLQGVTTEQMQQRAQTRSQQAQLQAQSTERERELGRGRECERGLSW